MTCPNCLKNPPSIIWRLGIGLLLALSTSSILSAQGGYIITTLAGLGGPAFSGDGGPALYAGALPMGVAVDSLGNVFIVDTPNSRVRKVSPQGIITTVAGNGSLGFSGDGGPATSAQLSLSPDNGCTPTTFLYGNSAIFTSGLTLDRSGNLFIADAGNGRIRKVTPGGTISTVAGGGSQQGDGIPATAAVLVQPAFVAVDAFGNLYVTDMVEGYPALVREVTSQGTITTVAGGGTTLVDGVAATSSSLIACGLTVDSSGNLYIADSYIAGFGNDRIRKVTTQGIISTVAGGGHTLGDGGPATLAALSGPMGVAVDSSGNIYIADSYNSRVRKVTPEGVIATIAGGSPCGSSCSPGDGGPATAVSFNPTGVAVDAFGDVMISDFSSGTIRELIPTPISFAGCVYSLDQSSQNFGIAGGSNSVSVLVTETSCSWLAISYAPWITINPTGLQSGLGLVSYTAAPNLYPFSRSGTIWIAGQSMTINQPALVCSWSVSPTTMVVPASGVVGASLSVQTNSPYCTWNIVENLPWVLVGSGTSGAGSQNISLTVGINAGGRRTGTMTVAEQTVTIAQAAASCKLTGDASPSVADIQLIMNEALGTIAATDDLNGDGMVNGVDLQTLIDGVLAGACAS